MGTDSLDRCPDDANDEAWPPDLDNNKAVNITDVVKFRPVLFSSSGQANYNRRFDLDASKTINITDVLKYVGIIMTSCT